MIRESTTKTKSGADSLTDRTRQRSMTVVGLGEAVFDCFPEHVALGGAPLNMAYHADQLLAVLGGRGVVATRIGHDALGDQLLSALRERGLTTDFIQRDAEAATGTVNIEVGDSGEPAYEIVSGAAWDRLEFDGAFARLAEACSAVCFGSLAQRSPQSKAVIERFVSNAKAALKVFDCNLRQNFYNAEILESSLRLATIAKFNEYELQATCELMELSVQLGDADECAAALRDEFELGTLALTRGSRGTVLYTAHVRTEGDVGAFAGQPNADSVGAGDACCAALIVGHLLNYAPKDLVRLANLAGAFVASQVGATPRLPEEILELVRPVDETGSSRESAATHGKPSGGRQQ